MGFENRHDVTFILRGKDGDRMLTLYLSDNEVRAGDAPADRIPSEMLPQTMLDVDNLIERLSR